MATQLQALPQGQGQGQGQQMFPVAVDPERERKGRAVPAPNSHAGKSPPPMEAWWGVRAGIGGGRLTLS